MTGFEVLLGGAAVVAVAFNAWRQAIILFAMCWGLWLLTT